MPKPAMRKGEAVCDDAEMYLRSVTIEERLPRYHPNELPTPAREFTDNEKRAALGLGDPKRYGGAPD